MSKVVALRKFMVWAVCKCDGHAVAYVEWGAAGRSKAEQMAGALTAGNTTIGNGTFFVQPRKVRVDDEGRMVA